MRPILIPFVALCIPIVVILSRVLREWIRAHYESARKLNDDDARMLAELTETAARLEGRMDALERVLDADTPHWRVKS